MSQPYAYLPAAHQHHGIEHSMALTGQVAGAAVGVAIGAVLIAAKGVGVLLIVPLALAGAEIGKQLAEAFLPPMTSGCIDKGATSVLYGPSQKPAARVLDPVSCSDPLAIVALTNPTLPLTAKALIAAAAQHRNKYVVMGAFGVTIEQREAARLRDLTKCAGSISSAIDSIWIGGFTIYADAPSSLTESNEYFDLALNVADLITKIVGAPIKLVHYGLSIVVDYVFGRESTPSLVMALVGLLLGGSKETRKELVETLVKKGGELVKIEKKGKDMLKGRRDNPALTPAMERRRKVLLGQRPEPTWSDTLEEWARSLNHRGNPPR